MDRTILRKNAKVLSDGVAGLVNIRPILPIVDHPAFQSLGFKHQLGVTFLVYPSAMHTRKAHSFGAYRKAKLLCASWRDMSMISEEEAMAIPAYALLHDIGHYPFSHVTEWLFPISHNARGLTIVETMRNEIEACDIDFELVRSLFHHSNPLYLAVSDKNLGMEKLDYLERDGVATIGTKLKTDYLREHTYWFNNQVVIDEKAIDEVKDIQNFYVKMFKNVYLRKGCVIAQRHFQKMTYLLLLAGEVTIAELSEMNDFELLGRLSNSRDPGVRKLFTAFTQRNLFKEGVVIRYQDFAHAERTGSKHIAVIGLADAQIDRMTQARELSDYHQDSLLQLEEKISRALGLQREDILVVTIVSPDRFKTKDVSIMTSNNEIASLQERYPRHFMDLAEIARAYTAFRVCAQSAHREILYQKSQVIADIILSHIPQD